jgi:hypothetical protein
MGRISEIISSFSDGLEQSMQEHEQSIIESRKHSEDFYNKFFKKLIVTIPSSNPAFSEKMEVEIRKFFGKEDLEFVAIDGSCDKRAAKEYISFFSCAYGAKGTIKLSSNDKQIEYHKWSLEEDVSHVAFLEIPYSRLVEIRGNSQEEQFLPTEDDRINVSNIHLPMMQLAEIYLAYSAAKNPINSPDIIMMDNSISTMLGHVDIPNDPLEKHIHLVGYDYDRRKLEFSDIEVAQAHPMNLDMGIPSNKRFTAGYAVIAFFDKDDQKQEATLDEIEKDLGMPKGKLSESGFSGQIQRLVKRGVITYDELAKKVTRKISPFESWGYTKNFFENVCERIFVRKESDALKYEVIENGRKIRRFMDPNDISFLIGVGLRALIEMCWKNKILLTGIAKDSESRYLLNNYLGVCKQKGVYPDLVSNKFQRLPATDRLLCQFVPDIDNDVTAPWSTIEFDSSVMTLYTDPNSGKITGTLGGIVRPEKIFLRSLAQFFLKRNPIVPTRYVDGQVIFVDRLAHPQWDGQSKKLSISGPEITDLDILLYPFGNTGDNMGQLINMYILDVVTKNHFAEVIGYPEPLHRADWGAKSLMRKMRPVLESADIKFNARPMSKTLRQNREAAHRR